MRPWLWAGLAATAAAVAPPLQAAAHRSLTAHMVQHLLLLVVAAPLLAAGAAGRRRPDGIPGHRIVANPWCALIAATAVLWIWHTPFAYDAGLSHDLLHAIEHTTFLLSGIWLWALVVGPLRLPGPGAALLVLAAGLPQAALGAVLAFAPYPLYAAHPSVADQQLAGVLMWVPPAALDVIVATTLFARWFKALEPSGRGRPS